MILSIVFSTLFVLIAIKDCNTQSTDLTLINRSNGSDVVEAVIYLIRQSNVFPDDYDFLKRVAYVESHYGNDNHTYRNNYFGGIWQLDRCYFDDTKNIVLYPALKDYYINIIRKFDINWTSVEWTDLEKPLYSGLAASLYLAIITEPIPQTITEQAIYWKKIYNRNANKTAEIFESNAHNLETNNECRGLVDLMIVMDGSRSIRSDNFMLAKQFVANFIGTFKLEKARIGFHVFSSDTYVIFPLSNNYTIDQMKNLITTATYPQSGTATDYAILEAMLEFESTRKHDGVPQVMAIFTDGKSNNDVTDAVKELQKTKIISFSIGIGSEISSEELLELAGNKTSRVFKLSSFSGLKDFVHRANEETCSQRQKPGINAITYDGLIKREKRYYEYELPQEGVTIVLEKTSGQVIGYYSYITEKPSSALNDGVIKDAAFIPQPNRIVINKRFIRDVSLNIGNTSSLFVTVEGLDVTNNYTINITTGNLISKAHSICDNQLILSPCVCDSNRTAVTCNSSTNYLLKVVFNGVNSKLNETISNQFNTLSIYNYGNDRLPEDVFGRILFKNILIFKSNIKHINSNAFVYTLLSIENFTLTNTRLTNNGLEKRNIFESVAKMIHLKNLDLSNNRLVSVPDNAFHPIVAQQKYLENITLENNAITRIGYKAFYDLPAITYINLSYNNVKQIGSHSFQMKTRSNKPLIIDLSANSLESLNFNRNWYANTLRPLTLILSNNKLQSIPATIFKVFLNRERENTLIADGNPIICNCSVIWLIEDKTFYMNKVLGVKCEDRRHLFDWDVQDFDNCYSFND